MDDDGVNPLEEFHHKKDQEEGGYPEGEEFQELPDDVTAQDPHAVHPL